MSRDQKFFDTYSIVIGVFAAVAIAFFVVSMKMADLTQGVYTRDTAEYQAAVTSRIEPFGHVYLPGEEQQSSAPTVATAVEPEPSSRRQRPKRSVVTVAAVENSDVEE